jgi:hypothetical protein
VAAVSLLVGGIGIMNIMLVGHRANREIGIRLAIGALERELTQFLVEAVVLSSVAGSSGSRSDRRRRGRNPCDAPFVFQPGIVVLAFVFSAAVGVVRLFPEPRPLRRRRAQRAARRSHRRDSSAISISGRPQWSAKRSSSAGPAMCPSGDMISQHTPTGGRFAARHSSTVASV